MKNVYILNGPPGCGKDTLASYLEDVTILRFKEPLIELAKVITDGELTDEMLSDRTLKEEPRFFKTIGWISPRRLLIKLSEDIIKPGFTKDIFGQIACSVVDKAPTQKVVFTDGGFYEEVEPIMDKHHVKVIQVFRDGCDFSNDSRKYLNIPMCTVRMSNNGTVEEGVHKLKSLMRLRNEN